MPISFTLSNLGKKLPINGQICAKQELQQLCVTT